MSAARPRRAAIVGFHGFGNLGDEAILAGIERSLQETAVEVTTLFGGRAPRMHAFERARRVTPPRLLPTPSALRALRGVDLLILGGGGLFNDHWPAVIPRYLAWVVAARLSGARVAWIGVGVGPIRRRAWRWMTRLAAALSDPVLVRDPHSLELVGTARASIIADPALFLDPPAESRREAVLALLVRPPVRDAGHAEPQLLARLEELASAGRTWGLEPRILLMAPRVDRPLAERLAERISAPVEALRSPRQALERLAACEAVVSVRLHGVLLSALCGVPCVPIAYDAKVRSAADVLGIGDLVIEPAALVPDAAGALMRAMDPERRARVAARVGELRATIDDVRRRLA